MKNIIILSALAFIAVSCKKVVSNGYQEIVYLGQNNSYTLNPSNNATARKIMLSETNFVSSMRGKIEAEQEALGKDIYDYELQDVSLYDVSVTAGGPEEIADPINNYIGNVSFYFDKNDINGSAPIKFASSDSINTELTIIQSDFLELTQNYPDFKIYMIADFDQIPDELRNAQIRVEFSVSSNYKYKDKK
ncbi:MAG: hypothetical protein AB8B56_08545 [Crocinitomicaceae bacterium]